MEACYGGTDVMERSCAVARGIDTNNRRAAVSEVKRPPGSRSGLKCPLELLEGPRYNSFSRRVRWAWFQELCIKHLGGPNQI